MTETSKKVKSKPRPYDPKRGEWCRLYASMLDHPVIQTMPLRRFKMWVNLLPLTRVSRGRLPPADRIAFRLRCSINEVEDDIAALIADGLLEWVKPAGEKPFLAPRNWTDWQPEPDHSRDRMRRLRERRNARSNGAVTDASQAASQSGDGDVTRHVTVDVTECASSHSPSKSSSSFTVAPSEGRKSRTTVKEDRYAREEGDVAKWVGPDDEEVR